MFSVEVLNGTWGEEEKEKRKSVNNIVKHDTYKGKRHTY
jgi:hypothetical protein